MQKLLFSAQGRLNRAAFWKAVLLIIVIAAIFGVVFFVLAKILPGNETTDGSFQVTGLAAIPYLLLGLAYIVFSFWAGICIGIKRYHDRDKSGAWVLIQFVPIIGPIWYLIEAGCLAGTPGANRYGADPLIGSAGSERLATT